MKFEEFEQEDILTLFNVLTKEVDQLFFLVDSVFRVQYVNQAFSNYIKKDVGEIIDQEFGEALGCANIHKDNKTCAFTSYCKTCEIRKYLHQAFKERDKNIEFELVREFKIANEILVKHIGFKIVPIRLHKTEYALCLMIDKRKEDDLAMFLNPDEFI